MTTLITLEDKKKYFPLLDDMGSMEEIYTLEELVARINMARKIPANSPWHKMWMKGVHIKADHIRGSFKIAYYGHVLNLNFSF